MKTQIKDLLQLASVIIVVSVALGIGVTAIFLMLKAAGILELYPGP